MIKSVVACGQESNFNIKQPIRELSGQHNSCGYNKVWFMKELNQNK